MLIRGNALNCEHDRHGLNKTVPVTAVGNLTARKRGQIAVAGSINELIGCKAQFKPTVYRIYGSDSAIMNLGRNNRRLQIYIDLCFPEHFRQDTLGALYR